MRGAPGGYGNYFGRTVFLSTTLLQPGPPCHSGLKWRLTMSDQELKELKHDPVPGYRPAFFVIFGLSLVYMIVIFLMSSPAGH